MDGAVFLLRCLSFLGICGRISRKGGRGRMDKKKAAAAAAVTVAAAAGMVTGTVFDSPADLMREPPAVVAVQADDDDGAAPEERQKGPAARIREWALSLPAAVRMLVGVPLWVLGWVLLTGLSTLWASALTPLLSRALGWLCLALLLVAVFACSVKAAFPDVPLRKILRPRNVLFLLGMTVLLAAADLALPAVWQGYDALSRTVWRVGATCLLAFSCCAAMKSQGKRAAAKKEMPVHSGRTAVEEEALRLADTVCGKR